MQKQYTVDDLGDSVFSVGLKGGQSITQMVWSVGELIMFCTGLNTLGYIPTNDWTLFL